MQAAKIGLYILSQDYPIIFRQKGRGIYRTWTPEVTLEFWGKGVLKLEIKYQLRELEILLPNEMLLLLLCY